MTNQLMTDEVPAYDGFQENKSIPGLPGYAASDERLPRYRPSLEYFGLSLIKTEFSSPYHYNNGNRSWRPVVLEINSTQLNIYELKVDKKVQELILALYNDANQLNDVMQIIQNKKISAYDVDKLDDIWNDAYEGELHDLKQSTSSRWKNLWHKTKYDKVLTKSISQYYDLIRDNRILFEPTQSKDEYHMFRAKFQGNRIASYTLSDISVGEAPSLNHMLSSIYKEDKSHINKHNISTLVKYKNTLRIRIELKQMLFQFWSFYGMVHWFRNLTVGKDLSSPLESRLLTKLKSIPSRNSRNNNLLAATEAAATLGMASDDDVDITCINDPFSSDPPKQMIQNMCCCNTLGNASTQSMCSNDSESLFSNERRESVVSTATDISSRGISSCKYNKQVNKYNLLSYDMVFATTVEKQYISNCIPDLNSFDKWCDSDVTVSNYSRFLTSEQLSASAADCFISSSTLDKASWGISKMLKKQHSQSNSCKKFVIHLKGLVSVVEAGAIACP